MVANQRVVVVVMGQYMLGRVILAVVIVVVLLMRVRGSKWQWDDKHTTTCKLQQVKTEELRTQILEIKLQNVVSFFISINSLKNFH